MKDHLKVQIEVSRDYSKVRLQLEGILEFVWLFGRNLNHLHLKIVLCRSHSKGFRLYPLKQYEASGG